MNYSHSARRIPLSLSIMCLLVIAGPAMAGAPVVWDLWPGAPPGGVADIGPEHDTTDADGDLIAGHRVARIINVTEPILEIYKPEPAKDTGAAVVVAPGGGFYILAYDLEGTEVAEWLNYIGVTAVVLKYRVPAQNREERSLEAAQDGQRAMSVVRGRAEELGIDPERIGMMGFSAGGAATILTTLLPERQYAPVDAWDEVPYQPNFAAPIYAGGMREGLEIGEDTPPFFLAIAHDDANRSINVAEFYVALKKAGVSAELHIYESGGHGYGLRRTDQPVTSWHDRMADWMRYKGFLEK